MDRLKFGIGHEVVFSIDGQPARTGEIYQIELDNQRTILHVSCPSLTLVADDYLEISSDDVIPKEIDDETI